jgi:hypothetical protein
MFADTRTPDARSLARGGAPRRRPIRRAAFPHLTFWLLFCHAAILANPQWRAINHAL